MPVAETVWGMDVESIKVDGAEGRILFYGVDPATGIGGYCVIAAREQDAADIKVGESVQYRPNGLNYGYFVGKWPYN
jgi:hypothetical protein